MGSQTRKSVEAVIERTGLTPESSKKIGQLSKGYRQRVGLAQALVHNPEILILDEPTSGLDPNQLTDIRKMITNIGKEKTIILSTHIMQEVEAMCSRVIIVSKGKIVANDTPKNVRQQTFNSGNPVKVEFTKTINKNIFTNNPAIVKVAEVANRIYLFSGNAEVDIRPIIFQTAVENEYIIVGMEQKQKHLEEVFQELTKTSAITQ
jgi:ABC-2 type transport system ATP-binding protein